MGKTGSGREVGTAEGALLGRAFHTRHAVDPVLRDDWAERLMSADARTLLDDPELLSRAPQTSGVDVRPFLAANIAALRAAEEEVVRGVDAGLAQYVILGAGFDTFALRHNELRERLRIFEIDHPDVQALKRERIAEAGVEPSQLPVFVPVDFETDALDDALEAAGYDPTTPAVFSWLNTIPYLTRTATLATLRTVSELAADESRLVLNYMPDVDMSEAHRALMQGIQRTVEQVDEPLMGAIPPDEFRGMIEGEGFEIAREDDERELEHRYFAGRSDGLVPDIPQRVVIARRVRR